jgi:ribosome-binding factor A
MPDGRGEPVGKCGAKGSSHESNALSPVWAYFCSMESTRQKKIASLLQRDLAEIFRGHAASEFPGTLVSVSKVRVSPDLGLCRVYLSVFPTGKSEGVMTYTQEQAPRLRAALAQKVRNQLRIIPELHYHLDDSMEYEANIDRLLKEGGENPFK